MLNEFPNTAPPLVLNHYIANLNSCGPIVVVVAAAAAAAAAAAVAKQLQVAMTCDQGEASLLTPISHLCALKACLC